MTSIAVVAFLVIVLINYFAMNDNRAALDEMEKLSYQVVKLTSASVSLSENSMSSIRSRYI